jgi:hypothetical protein
MKLDVEYSGGFLLRSVGAIDKLGIVNGIGKNS